MTPPGNMPADSPELMQDIRSLIEQSRATVARTVNTTLVMLYWQIGKRINGEVLQGERAEYGKQIVATLSHQLQTDYGSGFSAKNLHHMCRFASVIGETEIVSAVRRQLSWTHFRTLIYLEDSLQRSFYMEMCALECWSTRVLQEQIELLELGSAGIHVAEYLTVLPARKLLERKLHEAVAISRKRLENREPEQ
jgi:hypothetical protein